MITLWISKPEYWENKDLWVVCYAKRKRLSIGRLEDVQQVPFRRRVYGILLEKQHLYCADNIWRMADGLIHIWVRFSEPMYGFSEDEWDCVAYKAIHFGYFHISWCSNEW